MEEIAVGFINLMLRSGISETGILIFLLALIVVICISIWLFVIKPIKQQSKQLADSIDNQTSHIDDLHSSIDKLEVKINNIIENSNKVSLIQKEQLTDVHKDIDNIKQILSQFQGALLYNSRLFNNKELR